MNNKNLKVVSINGITALAIAIVVVLISVLVIFLCPIVIIREFWNYFVTDLLSLPEIGYLHAFLLWSAGALTIFVLIKNRIKISFQSYKGDADSDFEEILHEISRQNDIEEEEIQEIKDIMKDKK